MRKTLKKGVVAGLSTLFLLLATPSAFAIQGASPSTGNTFVGNVVIDQQLIQNEEAKKANLASSEKKLSADLLGLTNTAYLPDGQDQSELADSMEQQGQLKVQKGIKLAHVYIQLAKGADSQLLTPYLSKMEAYDKNTGLIAAYVDVTNIKELTSLDEVSSVRTIQRPHVYSVGSVSDEADSALRANLARAQSGCDGTGKKVGIISDGVDHLASSVSTGDLPGNVTVLSNTVGGDEGTAMLEIVHDLAPGAQLYFSDCGNSMVAFNNSVDALVNAGCTIICDDIGYFDEAFYAYGEIGDHIQNLIATKNIVYVTAAGNSGDSQYNDTESHYQGDFKPYQSSSFLDCRTGTTGNPNLYLHMPSGGHADIILQWNDPLGASGNDYDLYLTKVSNGAVLGISNNPQTGTQDPYESISFTNTGSATDVAILISKSSSAVAKNCEVYIYCSDGADDYIDNLVASDSIYGHAAVPGVITCGAVRVSTLDTLEYFSSQGPVTLVSGSVQKPDICGADGVSVTGVGGFGSPFYGTSAAAPHVAAITALLWSEFPANTSTQIRQVITSTAIDHGTTGFDTKFGYGTVDALNAVNDYYTVTYDSQGGDPVPAPVKVLKTSSCMITAPTQPTKNAATFGGWYKESQCVNAWDFSSDTVSASVTLYAKWDYQYTYSVSNGKATINSYTGTVGDITIPDTIDGAPVTSIASRAFMDNKVLHSVVLPDSIATIGDTAFANCANLASVKLPGSLQSISVSLFYNCTNLDSVTIPSSVTRIEEAAFGLSGLHSIIIPDGVTYIDEGAFIECSNLTDVTLPAGITTIERLTFSQCSSLKSISIPNGVTSIGSDAFSLSGLQTVTIPSTVTSIGDGAFQSCSGLQSITIPSGVTSIEASTFAACSSLHSITIPDGVTTIGTYAFSGCTSLTGVYFMGNAPSFTDLDRVFLNCAPDLVLYYLSGRTGYTNPWHGYPTATYTLSIASPLYFIDKANKLMEVSINTSVSQLKTNLNYPSYITVYDKNGNVYSGSAIASGMVAKLIYNGVVQDTLTLSVLGDISGDGVIDITDILYIRAKITNTYTMKPYQILAADVKKDDSIDITDILYIRAQILGTYTIHAN